MGKEAKPTDAEYFDAKERADKWPLVFEAGKAIRASLAANMKQHVGKQVDQRGLAETSEVLGSVFKNYLSAIIPEPNVRVFVRLDGEKATFLLRVTGDLEISIAPGSPDAANGQSPPEA